MSVNRPSDTINLRTQLAEAGVQPGEELRFVVLLIRNRLIRIDQVKDLVSEARMSGRGLAEQAVASGLASEDTLVELTAQIYGIEAVHLAKVRVEEPIAQLIELDMAREWGVLPYSRNDEGDLLVAISDPSNVAATDGLPKALAANGLREKIIFRVASPTELNAFIDQVYRTGAMDEHLRSDVIEEGQKLTVRSQAIEGSVVKLVDDLIYNAILDGASDIHIAPRRAGALVRFRVDGELTNIMEIPRARTAQVIARIKNVAGMKPDESRDAQDGRVTYETHNHEVDLRIVTIPVTVAGWDRPERVVMRVLDPSKALLKLDQLGMSADNQARFEQYTRSAHGLALVTGPTGSGKSTTLYAAMNSRMAPGINLASIEDPVEYQLEGIEQTSVSGASKMNFASALRAMMRADPDVIMVGEIRDRETATTAVEAALTGHFIYSTLHTNTAAGSLTRLRELGVDAFLLASTLNVVVAQRLIRLLCSDCKIPMDADADLLAKWNAPAAAVAHARANGPMRVYAPREGGCTRCKGRGYRGRTGVHEVLAFTEEMRRLVLMPEPPIAEIEALARAEGMHSLAEDAFRRVADGTTSLREYAEKAG